MELHRDGVEVARGERGQQPLGGVSVRRDRARLFGARRREGQSNPAQLVGVVTQTSFCTF
jgi:hypothetical protein